MPPRKRPAPAVDATGQQVGDQQITAAGRDLTQGANADAVLEFLRDYVFEADQQRETTIKNVGNELRRTRDEVAIVSDAVRSVRDRMDDDDHDRRQRQAQLDAALSELHRGQRIARRWLAGITAVLAAALAVVAWLLWRELGLLAARAAYDVALAVWRR